MNRKWLVLFLALLLCGCRNQHTPAEASGGSVPAIAVTEPTESVGFYDAAHPAESATGGAVKAYPLPTEDGVGIRFLGDDILLFSGEETTTLTLLSGENRYVRAQLQLSCRVMPDAPSLAVSDRGILYADSASGTLVTLNAQLEEISRSPLPEDCRTPVLSPDRQRLYYCTGDALRVLELETGLDKLLREMAFPVQELTGLQCNGTVLQCRIASDGSQRSLFLDASTGTLLRDCPEDIQLWTHGDFYIAFRMDGDYPLWLTGTGNSDPQVLVLDQEPTAMLPIPELESLLTYSARDDSTAFTECYQLESGNRIAQVTVPDICDLRSPRWNSATDSVWLLSSDASTGGDVLLAWSMAASEVSEEISYLQLRWTRTEPDLEGLAQCSLLARQISAKHGVNVLIWADATASQPWDYTLVPEYQVPLLRRRLEELDAHLAHYPEGLLERAAAGTGFGRLSICLVRSITGNTGTGALDSAMGLQFWDSDARAYLAVTLGADMAQHLHHELFHIIDSRILSTCNTYDDWSKLNPKGFSYDVRYTSDRSAEADAFLIPEERYFIDRYSMCYPKEDRARIMEYAMLDGQESLFHSPPMQAKLRKLCQGIRKAFGLEDDPVAYRWEQYLDTPLAPDP